VQDTLERAWRKLALWRPGSDLRAWLFTIMHNVFVNQVRARRVIPLSLDDEAQAEAPAGGSADPGRGTDLMDLDRALARLPDDQRAVLLLVGLEQFSYQEAADVLAVPIGTVMSRLHRGRERLRELLDGTAPSQALRVVK
jgi:RNA polymerase sigma-70 factor (ECF subfamily)